MPSQIRDETMWKFFGYRKALFLHDVCWKDCETLLEHPLGKAVARQLIRSVGSISANIEEGYGRGYGKERLYFLRIAIGSARESKGWYYRAKELLAPDVIEHRLNLIGQVIALLVTELNRSAKRQIKQIADPLIRPFADLPICRFVHLPTERKPWQNLIMWS